MARELNIIANNDDDAAPLHFLLLSQLGIMYGHKFLKRAPAEPRLQKGGLCLVMLPSLK